MQTNYLIAGPEENGDHVELWSSVRLPFEPKGWMLDMRNSLRSTLKRMPNPEKKILHAKYVSADEGFFDIENILIYNVGTGTFSELSRLGLCIERAFASPPQTKGESRSFSHYHRYCLMNIGEDSAQWSKEQSLAHWSGVPCSPLRGEHKPLAFWHAMKKGTIEILKKLEGPGQLGIELRINAPIGTRINLAGVIKPLLDGIISGLHSHDGTHNSIVVEQVARSIGEDEPTVKQLLMDRTTEVLGVRNLLHPFGEGIQWNPADDWFVMVKVVIDDCIAGSSWSLDGEVFTVAPLR